jgi:hypothetical protein
LYYISCTALIGIFCQKSIFNRPDTGVCGIKKKKKKKRKAEKGKREREQEKGRLTKSFWINNGLFSPIYYTIL